MKPHKFVIARRLAQDDPQRENRVGCCVTSRLAVTRHTVRMTDTATAVLLVPQQGIRLNYPVLIVVIAEEVSKLDTPFRTAGRVSHLVIISRIRGDGT